MTRREVIIRNRLGLHARPAAMFAKAASGFASDIRVRKDEIAVNGKSIMGLMMLAAAEGSVIEVEADGDDEAEAVEALRMLVESRFGEEG